MAPKLRDLERSPLLGTEPNYNVIADNDNNNNNNNENNNQVEGLKKQSKSPLEPTLANGQTHYGALSYDPLAHRKLDNPTTNLDTLMHMLNGNLGTGILAMPDAFKNAGLYVGLFGTLVMGLICTHCMHILVRCSHELCRRHQLPSLSYAEVGYYAVHSGPRVLRGAAAAFGRLINTFLIVMQLGLCCVYYLFVAVNLRDFLGYLGTDVSVMAMLLYLLVPLVLLNMIRSLKLLTPTSLVASVLAIAGITIAFVFLLRDLPATTAVAPVSTWSTLPLFFGTVMYAFEGIGVVLPLENNMAHPRDFRTWNGVLNTGMTIVACLYAAVGFYGYLKYGADAKGSVTLNLPSDLLLAQCVRLLMAIAVLASYALQFYVPMTILAPVLHDRCATREGRLRGEYLLRIGTVLLTFVLAAIIPNLGTFISLVGAVSTSTLALIFPPLIEIICRWPAAATHRWLLLKDFAIVAFGATGFCLGTARSIAQIVSETAATSP